MYDVTETFTLLAHKENRTITAALSLVTQGRMMQNLPCKPPTGEWSEALNTNHTNRFLHEFTPCMGLSVEVYSDDEVSTQSLARYIGQWCAEHDSAIAAAIFISLLSVTIAITHKKIFDKTPCRISSYERSWQEILNINTPRFCSSFAIFTRLLYLYAAFLFPGGPVAQCSNSAQSRWLLGLSIGLNLFTNGMQYDLINKKSNWAIDCALLVKNLTLTCITYSVLLANKTTVAIDAGFFLLTTIALFGFNQPKNTEQHRPLLGR